MTEVTFAPQSSPHGIRLPAWRGLVVTAGFALAPGLPAAGPAPFDPLVQTLRLTNEAAFHADPDGTFLGTLQRGASVTPGRSSGGWRLVTFDGWIFTASTGPAPRPEFSLAVDVEGGENVRDAPDGDLVARAVRGTGFTRIGRRGGWTQVRRAAWVRAGALGRTPVGGAERQVAPPPPPTPAPVPPTPPPVPVQESAERVLIRRGAALSAGPGGASLGAVPQDLAAEVLGRSGNWVRVRTDTWVRADDIRPAPPDSGALTLERLRADPDKYVGQTVTWRLQFLSVRTADELRPELPPGQPYLLTRGPLPEVGFVYVVVTPEQARRFQAMNPLDEFVARGVLRAARIKYLPTPVVELR